MARVSLIIGSESDRELGEKAEAILKDFGVDHDFEVFSAHRNPQALKDFVEASDSEVFIAIAGLSAALPGFIAAHTLKPVIGVPKDVKLGGLDSLLSIVQMPTGVPVACVGVDNARNAALLAIEILALADEGLKEKLGEYRRKRASRN
ncbi:5-(carboxyamino)imidazole ribonucleotide mutase [Candidatus Bathyarchaeota archaeon]|nr:MAG: 5-(carboxyamino)imidazole ribonucleotide mutase [Candidatus Bathyarchaeota archaeon]